jgi:hypothetical protein
VMRIAPKPRRLTVRSPPNWKVGFVAIVDAVDEAAPKIISDPPAKSAAPLARVVPRNVRRVTLGFCFASTDSSAMTRSVRSRKRLSTRARSSAFSFPSSRVQCHSTPSLRSRIRTTNASSRSFPNAKMPPSCPAMTKIFLLCTSVVLKRRVTSDAISGVP